MTISLAVRCGSLAAKVRQDRDMVVLRIVYVYVTGGIHGNACWNR
jgi:hypothetical protein